MNSWKVFALCLSFYLPLPASESPLCTTAADSCARSCVVNADCGVGGLCDNKKICRYRARYCSNERWATNERGESSNCDAYQCDEANGTCLRSAVSSADCTEGYVFDEQGACTPSVQCDPQDAACQNLLARWKKTRNEYEQRTPQPQISPLSCIACSQHSQCGSSQMCWKNRCVTNDLFCTIDSGGNHFVSSKSEAPISCGNYACQLAESRCLTQCLKPQDCAANRNCVAGQCL